MRLGGVHVILVPLSLLHYARDESRRGDEGRRAPRARDARRPHVPRGDSHVFSVCRRSYRARILYSLWREGQEWRGRESSVSFSNDTRSRVALSV